jgi:hypothetical protein
MQKTLIQPTSEDLDWALNYEAAPRAQIYRDLGFTPPPHAREDAPMNKRLINNTHQRGGTEDAEDLGSSGETRAGSTPAVGTGLSE